MKYLVFKHHSLFMPVIFPDHISHSQVKLEDCELVSGGFYDDRTGSVYGRAESVGLKPNKERDGVLIRSALLNSGTSSFLDYEQL